MHFKKMKMRRPGLQPVDNVIFMHCTIDPYLLNHLDSSRGFLFHASNWSSAKNYR